MRIVYADVVLASNFCIDFVILFLTGYIYKIRMSKKRIALSSLFGALFSLVVVIFDALYVLTLVFCFFAAAVMLLIAFGKRSIKVYVRLVITFYMLSFIMSSFVQVCLNVYVQYKMLKGEFPVWIVFTGAGMLMLFCMLFSRYLHETVSKKRVSVWVQTEKASKEYLVLCDSGNLLCDPFSNLPVIVLKKQAEKELCENDGTYASYIQNHIRYIPVSSALGNGVVRAIKPKSVSVRNNRLVYKNVDAIIAFSPNEINDFGGSDGIIAQSVVETIN